MFDDLRPPTTITATTTTSSSPSPPKEVVEPVEDSAMIPDDNSLAEEIVTSDNNPGSSSTGDNVDVVGLMMCAGLTACMGNETIGQISSPELSRNLVEDGPRSRQEQEQHQQQQQKKTTEQIAKTTKEGALAAQFKDLTSNDSLSTVGSSSVSGVDEGQVPAATTAAAAPRFLEMKGDPDASSREDDAVMVVTIEKKTEQVALQEESSKPNLTATLPPLLDEDYDSKNTDDSENTMDSRKKAARARIAQLKQEIGTVKVEKKDNQKKAAAAKRKARIAQLKQEIDVVKIQTIEIKTITVPDKQEEEKKATKPVATIGTEEPMKPKAAAEEAASRHAIEANDSQPSMANETTVEPVITERPQSGDGEEKTETHEHYSSPPKGAENVEDEKIQNIENDLTMKQKEPTGEEEQKSRVLEPREVETPRPRDDGPKYRIRSLVDEVLDGIDSCDDASSIGMAKSHEHNKLLESAMASGSSFGEDEDVACDTSPTTKPVPSSVSTVDTATATTPTVAIAGDDTASDSPKSSEEKEEDLNLIERIKRALLLDDEPIPVVFTQRPKKLTAIVEEENPDAEEVKAQQEEAREAAVADEAATPDPEVKPQQEEAREAAVADEAVTPDPEPNTEDEQASDTEKELPQTNEERDEASDRVFVEVVQDAENETPRLTREAHNYMYGECPSDERETDIVKPKPNPKVDGDQEAIEIRIPLTGSTIQESSDVEPTKPPSGLVSYQTLTEVKEAADLENASHAVASDSMPVQEFDDFAVLAATLGGGNGSAEIMGLFSNLLANNQRTPNNE